MVASETQVPLIMAVGVVALVALAQTVEHQLPLAVQVRHRA
jgi:hypothetical protein